MKKLLLLLFPTLVFSLSYEVHIHGVEDKELIRSLEDSSDLFTLQTRPPASINGIKYRISGDIPEFLKTLRAYGYYDASISTDLDAKDDFVTVNLNVYLGELYKIEKYQILSNECESEAKITCCEDINPESLGVAKGAAAKSVNIVNAELNLLSDLAGCGHPLAKIKKREVIVDMQEKTMEARVCVDEGPMAQFGPTTISGLKSVKSEFIQRRIAWTQGNTYSTYQIQETQKRLLNSDLFSSVLITHAADINEACQLPLQLRLTEAKHKQITIGAFYATVDGPGGIFTWTNRNFRGLGETIAIDAEVSERYLSGTASYKKPDIFTLDQNYKALAQISRERIRAYTANMYRFANYLEKKFEKAHDFSIGLEVQKIIVTNSANNDTYLLLDMPIFAKLNTADDLLNPTKGYSIVYQPQFFQSLDESKVRYLKQRLTTCFYIPVIQKWLIFAVRAQVGSIVGAKRQEIPIPVLFLGGSEDDLRGYRYLTVSPLDSNHKPFGGRSAIFLTTEMRFRLGEKIGIVPFFDSGTVTFSELPTVNAKWFKSIGIGLRYFTFFGPLRFDVGYPLDRRHSIDPAYRIYASIGQAF